MLSVKPVCRIAPAFSSGDARVAETRGRVLGQDSVAFAQGCARTTMRLKNGRSPACTDES